MASLLGPVAGSTAQADKTTPATTTAKPDRSPPNEASLDSSTITDRPRAVNRASASIKYARIIVLKSGLLVLKFRATFSDHPDINRPETVITTHPHRDPIGRHSSVKEVSDLLTGVLRHQLQLRHSGFEEPNSAQLLTIF
jgi:hypothetical protein